MSVDTTIGEVRGLLEKIDRISISASIIDGIVWTYLAISNDGGVFDVPEYRNVFEILTSKAINKIKEKKIITNDNDSLLFLIRKCHQMAIDGVPISYSKRDFIREIASLYYQIKENSLDTSLKNRPGLELLYRRRKAILIGGEVIEDEYAKMFDFIEMKFIDCNAFRRVERYRNNNRDDYYRNDDEKQTIIKMAQDLKPYIRPDKHPQVIGGCCCKFNKVEAEIYIQAFLMLTHGVSFEKVYSFIEMFCVDEKVKGILFELANYSKNGVEFFEYFVKRKKWILSDEEKGTLKDAEDARRDERLRRRWQAKSKKSRARVYEAETFSSIREKYEYIEKKTKSFNLIRILLRGENKRGIIVIGNNGIHALDNVSDCKGASMDVIEVLKTRRDSSSEFAVIEISNESGLISIESYIPDDLKESQCDYLNGIVSKLSYVKAINRCKIYDKNRERNGLVLDETIQQISNKTSLQSIRKQRRKILFGNNRNNSQ